MLRYISNDVAGHPRHGMVGEWSLRLMLLCFRPYVAVVRHDAAELALKFVNFVYLLTCIPTHFASTLHERIVRSVCLIAQLQLDNLS